MLLRRHAGSGPQAFSFRGALAGLLLILTTTTFAEARVCDVAIFLTSSEPYKQVATALREDFARTNRHCEIVELNLVKAENPGPEATMPTSQPADEGGSNRETESAIARLKELKPRIVVSVGTAATTLARQSLEATPIVYCMVANVEDREFATNPPDPRLHGVTTDVDPAEQMRWVKRLSPAVKTVGVLHSERSKRTVDSLIQAARDQGIRVEKIPATLGEFPAAIHTLDEKDCDAVLMIADANVYDSASVQRLLLWGLRNRKPVWSFSSNIVKAGAFAGLYPDSGSIARQTAALALQLLDKPGERKAERQFPRRVLTAVNERTAEMIRVALDKEALQQVAVRFGQH
jgi:ABC-type uncharacterized transport system substrate-binding protein